MQKVCSFLKSNKNQNILFYKQKYLLVDKPVSSISRNELIKRNKIIFRTRLGVI